MSKEDRKEALRGRLVLAGVPESEAERRADMPVDHEETATGNGDLGRYKDVEIAGHRYRLERMPYPAFVQIKDKALAYCERYGGSESTAPVLLKEPVRLTNNIESPVIPDLYGSDVLTQLVKELIAFNLEPILA